MLDPPGDRPGMPCVPTIMDPDDRQAFIDIGLDPDALSVRAALDLVRWALQHFLGFDVTEP
jgi:hypothetical protein